MKKGFYNEHSIFQRSGLNAALPLVIEAAKNIQLPLAGTPLNVLDCGCSQGRNSVVAITCLLETLEQRLTSEGAPPAQPLDIAISHEDLPQNDFGSLIQAIYDPVSGYTRLGAASAVFRVYPSCVGMSFYSRLVPARSQSILMAYMCIQYLRKKPCKPTDTLLSYLSDSGDVRTAFQAEFFEGFTQ